MLLVYVYQQIVELEVQVRSMEVEVQVRSLSQLVCKQGPCWGCFCPLTFVVVWVSLEGRERVVTWGVVIRVSAR